MTESNHGESERVWKIIERRIGSSREGLCVVWGFCLFVLAEWKDAVFQKHWQREKVS